MPVQLREYQSDAQAKLVEAFAQYNKLLGVWPTGGGKTILFSDEAKRRNANGERVLILAHRAELLDQAVDKLRRSTGIQAQKEKAESRASQDCPVVVGSIQTLGRRFERWHRDHFGLIVVDEAHRILAKSYQEPLSHFSAQILGVTATPDRGDKKNLGSYFDAIAFEERLYDWKTDDGQIKRGLINQGFLCPITIKSIPLKIDLTSVGCGFSADAGGQDYNAAQLGSALEPYLDSIARHVATECAFRTTLAFLPLIATSKKFVDACVARGINARHIDGDSPDREEILADFEAGKFEVLSNAMLLTEGYDNPIIDALLVLRPTRVRSLYAQMVGRGTRIHPTKEDLLLLDFLWNHKTHNLCRPAHLIAKSDEEAEAITVESQKTQAGLPAGVADTMPMDLQSACNSVLEQRERALRKRLEENAKRKLTSISAADYAAQHGNFALADYLPTMAWESQPITDKQASALRRAKIDVDTVQGKGHASKLLDMVFRNQPLQLASEKAVDLMRRMPGVAAQCGIHDFENVTSQQAGMFFAKLRERKK